MRDLLSACPVPLGTDRRSPQRSGPAALLEWQQPGPAVEPERDLRQLRWQINGTVSLPSQGKVSSVFFPEQHMRSKSLIRVP